MHAFSHRLMMHGRCKTQALNHTDLSPGLCKKDTYYYKRENAIKQTGRKIRETLQTLIRILNREKYTVVIKWGYQTEVNTKYSALKLLYSPTDT